MAENTKITIQVLGSLQVRINNAPVDLPPSRKTRALLAYLALENRPISRGELCNLLWEDAEDPRAALRWSLSKLRHTFAAPTVSILRSDKNTIALDPDRIQVDTITLIHAINTEPDSISTDALTDFERQFDPNMLAELDTIAGISFRLWLESKRKQFQEIHSHLVQLLLDRPGLADSDRLRLAGRRVSLLPLQDSANIDYLRLMTEIEGLRAARTTLEKIRKVYRQEKQSEQTLLAAWRQLTAIQGSSQVISSNSELEYLDSKTLPDKPSLAVLDFTVIGDRDASVLTTGLTVDLNSRLARMSHLFVIARASSARLSAMQLSPAEIAARLGVRYLVAGTVQRDSKRIRVTTNLLDAAEEHELWSEQFDVPVDGIFAIQDEITGNIIAAIEPAIQSAEIKRALLRPPENLNAWEHFHRGLWHSYRFMPDDNETAHKLFTQAIKLDPQFSRAYAGLSFTHYSRAFLNATTDAHSEIDKSLEAGLKSVDLDHCDAMAHWSLSRALFLSEKHDDALAAIDKSLALNPNYAQGHYTRGFICTHSEEDKESQTYLDSAQRLSPFDPLLFAMKSTRGVSLANQGKYDEAATWAIRATHEPNAHFHIHAIAGACLELAGRRTEAKTQSGRTLELHPNYNLEVFKRSFPQRNEAHRQELLRAMATAGIPRAKQARRRAN